MDVNLHKYIYIRTSLNTTFWDYTGRNQDIAEIIPVSASFG
jgi:hypothetical protein